ncbi:Oidioi.mRNA.OKI2018_I69.chr1.g3074.t1.cds [Oikopleura dioica]|uniref:Oidioi.mRNA.OKI2018_I69.chr1.g3074.t1.cds n=1 Tax=Oikopleura dioica TaxID=34765 RepID=A0ABN7SX98_OIKDI|nr:Oidioi.mRNA.OKI2018_I69.chr1.g3074.t1.cds [Oikopleura dioica]
MCANTAGCYKLNFDSSSTTCTLLGNAATGYLSSSAFALNGIDCSGSSYSWTDYKVSIGVSVLFGTSDSPADLLARLKQNNNFSWTSKNGVTDVPDLIYSMSVFFEPVITQNTAGLTTPTADQVWITFEGLIYFREASTSSRKRRQSFSINTIIETQAVAAANDVTDNVDSAGATVDETSEPETVIEEVEPVVVTTTEAPATTTTVAPGETPCDSGDISLQTSAKCCPDHFGIAIHSCVFEKLNMDPSAASLVGQNAASSFNPRTSSSTANTCGGTLINGEYHFGEQGKITDCGNEIVSNDTHIVIKSSIQGVAGVQVGKITRERRLKVDLECAFPRVLRVSTGSSPIMTSLFHFVADLGETIGNFDVSMGVFKDAAFSTNFAADEIVSIPQPLFVKSALESASDNFKLQLNRCWATPNDDPQDEISYSFVENFCGNEAEISGDTLEIFENGEESFASFRLTSFEFNDASTVFLHCDVRICDSSIENCVPNCSSRRKRRSIDDENYHTITSGPIQVFSP